MFQILYAVYSFCAVHCTFYCCVYSCMLLLESCDYFSHIAQDCYIGWFQTTSKDYKSMICASFMRCNTKCLAPQYQSLTVVITGLNDAFSYSSVIVF